MKCKCGEFELGSWAPWEALTDEVHTAHRCGRFVNLKVEAPFDNPPTLLIHWPDGEELRPDRVTGRPEAIRAEFHFPSKR
jgi:hypothetical protein